MEITEIEQPVVPEKTCESDFHFLDLIVFGKCNRCSKVWGLSEENV